MPRITRLLMMIVGVWASVLGRISPVSAQQLPAAKADATLDASPLLHEPKTPEEIFSAVLLMVDLARFDLAGRYLQQFIETNPDDELLIKLRDKYGTGEFLKLSRIKQLKEQAQGLLDQLSAASRQQAEDPAYAEVLIAKLGQGPVQRELAVRELRNLGEAAVPHLLRKLADPASDEQADQIVMALSRIGQPAISPTIAGLESPSNNVRLGVLSALSLIKSPVAVPFLWHPAFNSQETPEVQQGALKTLKRLLSTAKRQERATSQQAALELRMIAQSLYDGRFSMPTDDDGSVVIWAWDDMAGTVVRKSMPPDRAQLYWSTRFARQSFDLSPGNPEAQRLYLGSLLGWTVSEHGRDRLISMDPETPGYVALTAGEQIVTDVLADALAAGQPGTAQAALQILGQIGSHQMIFSGRGRKSPVLSALNYPDLRVQFAAANTVLRLEPDKTFRGADRVVSILSRAITTADQPRALIIDADTDRAELTAGFLSDLGYLPIPARTGKEGFQIAATTAGIDLAVIQINCIRWDLSQTVANLRADARTAYLPIVFYGPEDVTDVQSRFGRKNAIAFPEAASSIWNGLLPPGGRADPLVAETRMRIRRLILESGPATFVAESGSADDFVHQVRPFMTMIAGGHLSAEERSQYQSVAAGWLTHLSQVEKESVFDLSPAEGALAELTENPDLAAQAIVALSGIESLTVQKQFLIIVVNPQHASALRVSAANQLAFHIQRHGILLTEGQVLELTAAWNKEGDPAVASALASVIGSLHPNQSMVGERIGRLPAPK